MSKSLYHKHVEKLGADIASGAIASGERLPTHRDYAYRHGLAPGTVARVYSELARRGLATGEVGRGTFARLPKLTPRDVGAGLGQHEGAVRRDLIDLTLNYPVLSEQTEKLREALQDLSNEQLVARYLAYQPHGGALGDRERIAEYASVSGLQGVDPAAIVLTQGGQHGIALALLSLCRPGDRVACESLTYPGFKFAAESFGVDLIPIECDQEGIVPSVLADVCLAMPIKALYCMPTVHNPCGWTTSEQRRVELLGVAEQHGLIVIEDAAYAFLEENSPPPLAQLAPHRVVYIDSFSKIIAPGLRAGYIATGNPHWAAALAHGVRVTTWSATPLSMGLVARWLNDGTVQRWAKLKRQHARRLQQIIRSALPANVKLEGHETAFHALVHLPAPWRADDFTISLATDGVAVSPSRAFAVLGGARPAPPEAVRLAFGGVSEADLLTALTRFRRWWEDPFTLSNITL